jgi:hypothetical protein
MRNIKIKWSIRTHNNKRMKKKKRCGEEESSNEIDLDDSLEQAWIVEGRSQEDKK